LDTTSEVYVTPARTVKIPYIKRVEVGDCTEYWIVKRASLLRKKFYNIGPSLCAAGRRRQRPKTVIATLHFLLNLRAGPISESAS
jgi:hypothetical protein